MDLYQIVRVSGLEYATMKKLPSVFVGYWKETSGPYTFTDSS